MVFVDVKQHYMFIIIIIQNHMWHECSESAGELRIALLYYPHYWVSRDSSVVRALDSWLKGRGFESLQEWRENLFSRVNFLCWLLFQYPFHPRVTAVACKRSWSFCQKCRWQLNTHTPYVCGFAWSDMVHGCMVHTELVPRWLQFHVARAMPAL